MVFGIQVLVIVLVALVNCSNCCNSYEYKTINYNVVDCDQTLSESLGDFVLRQKRKRRNVVENNTCAEKPIHFLTPNIKKSEAVSSIGPTRVAGAFVYNFYTAKEKIFWGAGDTVAAIKEGKTLNIIIDSQVNFFVFILKPKKENGEAFQEITSSRTMDLRKFPEEMEVVSCENLFAYLSREGKPFVWSVTITDESNSNAEYRFRKLSGGIGGFISKKKHVNEVDA